MTFDTFFGLFNQTLHAGNTAYAVALYAQAKLESGNFGSKLFADYNNMFGMKCSAQRQRFWDDDVTLSGETFATYATPAQSLADRLNWDEYNGIQPPEEPEEVQGYMNIVKGKGYATDPQYVTKWVSVVNGLSDDLGGFDGDIYDHVGDGQPEAAGFSVGKWLPYLIAAIVLLYLWKRFKKR